jgi:hypothetical protein
MSGVAYWHWRGRDRARPFFLLPPYSTVAGIRAIDMRGCAT